jgi:hypothetical protein
VRDLGLKVRKLGINHEGFGKKSEKNGTKGEIFGKR